MFKVLSLNSFMLHMKLYLTSCSIIVISLQFLSAKNDAACFTIPCILKSAHVAGCAPPVDPNMRRWLDVSTIANTEPSPNFKINHNIAAIIAPKAAAAKPSFVISNAIFSNFFCNGDPPSSPPPAPSASPAPSSPPPSSSSPSTFKPNTCMLILPTVVCWPTAIATNVQFPFTTFVPLIIHGFL